MAKVQKTVITALGEQMLFSSALTYTDATLCSQDVSNLTTDQLRALTDLTGKVLSSPISAHKRQGNTKADQVDVQVTFTNQDQKADINYSSIGWFARDRQGHETLIAVTPFVGTDTIAAAPPDGAATSSKNITLSMAAGTATEINVLIDPAGSVTPSTFNVEVDKINEALALKADNAELADYAKTADVNKEIKTVTDLANTKVDATYSYSKAELDKKLLALSTDTSGKVNASQVASMIAGKADKTDVDQKIATVNKSVSDLSDTVSANKTATDASLATKANASDVADNVKTLQANIDTKADKATVDAEIAKIDFTPYAKSADVDSKLKGYTDTADLTKLLAGKADSDFSYSKAELDKKLLDLTTTTGGKVDANQVATMIENKADKSDVTKQIGTITDLVNTKANSTDVDAALDKKDDTTDVDSKIKKVTDLANAKANVGDVYNISAIDTAFSQRDSKITNLQNSALQVIEGHADDDILSFRDDKVRVYSNCQNVKNLPPMVNEVWFYTVTRLSHGWGSVTVISQDNCYWQNARNGDTWAGWTKHATSTDIDNLTNQINQKANAGDVSALQGKVNVSAPLFREISDDSTWEDIFGVTNPNNVLTSLRINPGGNGQLVNDHAAGIGFGGSDTKAVITVDYGSHVARFTAGNGTSPGWSEDVAWKSDISSLTQALTKLQAAFDAQQTKIAALQATVNNQANQLTYFKQHYIEGKAFDADQIKQAMAWTGDDGQKLAIIRDKENEGGK